MFEIKPSRFGEDRWVKMVFWSLRGTGERMKFQRARVPMIDERVRGELNKSVCIRTTYRRHVIFSSSGVWVSESPELEIHNKAYAGRWNEFLSVALSSVLYIIMASPICSVGCAAPHFYGLTIVGGCIMLFLVDCTLYELDRSTELSNSSPNHFRTSILWPWVEVMTVVLLLLLYSLWNICVSALQNRADINECWTYFWGNSRVFWRGRRHILTALRSIFSLLKRG